MAVSRSPARPTRLTSSPPATPGHRLKVSETASNAGGASAPATSAATAVVPSATPANTGLPTITGTAQEGQTLTEQHGTWTNTPTSFAYQWLQCNSLGEGCLPIAGANAQTYVPRPSDVGSTIRVSETASNESGPSAPATSAATPAVTARATAATFGTTTVGGSGDSFTGGRKRVNRYSLPAAGTVSKLSVYLTPTTTAGTQVMEGVIYSDAAGKPQSLLAVSAQITFASTSPAGWYDLTLESPVKLAAGSYWIGVITGPTANVAGFRYTPVPEARAYNPDAYSDGPTATFGTAKFDNEQMSLFATYTPG